MDLYELNIDGEKISDLITNEQYDVNLVDSVPFKFSETPITNYTIVTDLEVFTKYMNDAIGDYIIAHDVLSGLFYTKAGASLENYATLTDAEKLIACVHKLAPKDVCMSFLQSYYSITEEEAHELGIAQSDVFYELTKIARKKRLKRLILESFERVGSVLSKKIAFEFQEEQTKYAKKYGINVKQNFIDFSIRGIKYSEDDGIIDYWEGTGLWDGKGVPSIIAGASYGYQGEAEFIALADKILVNGN